MISIPEYTPLGAYAEEHPDELCRFVTELFDAKEPAEITDSDLYNDFIEVSFAKEWFNGESLIVFQYDVGLYGSTRNFHIVAPLGFSKKYLDKWADWCIRHCGHWALGEEEARSLEAES